MWTADSAAGVWTADSAAVMTVFLLLLLGGGGGTESVLYQVHGQLTVLQL